MITGTSWQAEAQGRSIPSINGEILNSGIEYQEKLFNDIAEYEVAGFNMEDFARIKSINGGHLSFNLSAGIHSWKIDLYQHDVRSDDYRLLVTGDEGEAFFPKKEAVTYKGYAGGDPGNIVLATISDDFVNFTIKSKEGTIEIEPISWYSSKAGDNEYIVYNRNFFDGSRFICGTEDFIQTTDVEILKRKGGSGEISGTPGACKQFNAVLFATSDLTSSKGGVTQTEAYLQGMFNKVQQDYRTNLDIELVLTGIVVSTSTSTDPQGSRSDHSQYLASIQSWGSSGALDQFEHDLAGIIISGGITGCSGGNCGTVAGHSKASTVCIDRYKYMWASDFIGAITLAHEWGHMFGVGHDNYNVGGYNMTGSCPGPNPTTNCGCMMCAVAPTSDIFLPWSQRSKDMVAAYAASASCAKTCGPVKPSASFFADKTSGCGTLEVQFTDNSQGQPTSWLWDFGDGNTSAEQNPKHTYASPGTYTVTLTAINENGDNSVTKTSYIKVGSGDPSPAQKAGPPTNSFGQGGYFTANSIRGLFFDALQDIVIQSVKVYSGEAGERIVEILDASQKVIFSTKVNIPSGESRAEIFASVPKGSNYLIKISSNLVNLYRNNLGGSYPYKIDGLVSITKSNAEGTPTAATDFYYYFYDWEVRAAGCSPPSPVSVSENSNDAIGIFPNPGSGKFQIYFPESLKDRQVTVTVYDLIGRQVFAINPDISINELNLSGLHPGSYFVKLQMEGLDVTKKINIIR